MRPINVTVGPLAAASANNVCTSQAIAANASFAINGTLASGGVATTEAEAHGHPHSLTLTLPPLATLILERVG